MFQTLRAKIIVLTLSILVMLFLMVIGVSLSNYESNKNLVINGTQFNIEGYTKKINAEMAKLEDNAMSLALLGEAYFKSDRSDDLLKQLIQEDFNDYPASLGGGVWFRPYQVNKNQRFNALYAYRDETGEIVFDPEFSGNDYDYPMQRWYLEIMSHLTNKNRLAWTSPYFENQGAESLMTTVGAGIYHQDELVGLATVDWKMDSILTTISNMKPTPNSFVLFADQKNDFIISTTDKNLIHKKTLGLSLKLIPWYHDNLTNQSEFLYQGKVFIPYVKTLNNGMVLIVNVPKEELFASSYSYMKIILSLLLISCVFIAWGLYGILQKNINKPVAQLSALANKIGQGNLDIQLHLRKPKELAVLADTLNKMAKDLKINLAHLAQMSKAKEKIEAELSVAHQIQWDALPHQFPVENSFECVASMTPAKDVGGDFYDFFFVDKNHLAFVMADVSGKGITAALLMMSAKTMIRHILQSGHPLKVAVQKVNKALCENNTRGMFVTAFIGILDLKSGHYEYVNAGHCPPAVQNKKGYCYLTLTPNLVLGVLPDFEYQLGKGILQKGERIFLYTDGVTEAQNKVQKLYGPVRLLNALNHQIVAPHQTLACVQKDIARFVQKAQQSDDITMMEILYYGQEAHAGTFSADIQEWPKVVSFLKKQGPFSKKQFDTLLLITEEIFTNIAKYAYETIGTVRLSVQTSPKLIHLQFKDFGKPYNPLKHKKPDIHQSAQKRPIGGLGLYMVQKMVEQMVYQRQGNQNVLSIKIKRTKE